MIEIPMKIREELCRYGADRRSAIIVVESDHPAFPRTIEALRSKAARDKALAFAASNGVPGPMINDTVPDPYPVNSSGIPLDEVTDKAGQPVPYTDKRMKAAAYRIEVTVASGLRA
jgi:hypothetical protein